jgi:hypothetical protein
MNGHPLVLGGGLEPSFFGSFGYQPGLLLGGSTELFLDSNVIWIGGIPTEFFFPPGTLFMTSFTLPTNGRSFKVPVEISFFITGVNFDTGQTIDVSGGASGSIFVFFAPNGCITQTPSYKLPSPAHWD